MSEVSFDTTPEETATIVAIVNRVMAGPAAIVSPRTRLDVDMDIAATHANGCPLDLEKLLAFDDSNFWHDIAGIFRHLDRETGKLTGFFVPRCALPTPAEVES